MKNFLKASLYMIMSIALILHLSGILGMSHAESVILPSEVSDVDIYFVGSSGALRGISPMHIYDEYGYTSYVFGASWAQIPLQYYMIKENLNRNKPKLIAFDIESFFDEETETADHLHHAIDAMPLNANKMELINYDAWNYTIDDKMGLMFPFFRFHDKWADNPGVLLKLPDKEKQSCTYSICYGYMNHSTIVSHPEDGYMSRETTETDETYIKNSSAEYILKTKELCEKNGIEMFLFMPPHKSWSDSKHEKVARWAEENGMAFIDYNTNYEDTKIDIMTDFYDGNHLNISGAYKLSESIADYIGENYGTIDHRGEQQYHAWDNDLGKYKEYEASFIEEYQKFIKSA